MSDDTRREEGSIAANCEPCALRADGATDRALGIEILRSQRLLLAYLSGDQAEVKIGDLADDIGGCYDCALRLAATYLGGYARGLVAVSGEDIDVARRGVAHTIEEIERRR